ncbi:MAG: hypothetical protein IJD99_02810 [Clostridia bacterium]|nr:hypothetical protein [Clostridia bacterium]
MKLKKILSILLSLVLLTVLLPASASAAVKLPKGYQALVENDRFIVGVNTSNCFFCVADKALGEVFESNPANWKTDKKATGSNKTKLQSQMVVTVLRGETENTETVNSQVGSVSKGSVKLQKVDDGLRILYTFKDYGITVPLYVTIAEDCFRVYVPADEIEETTADKLLDMEIAPLLGATGTKDEGYILIPDGSGALIRFNNGKTKAGSYKAQVYGSDKTFAATVDNNTMLRAALPVLGMDCGDYGLMAVATQGDAHAYVNAAVSGVTNSYNTMNFSFSVRAKGEYTIGEENYNARTVNLYQQDKSTLGRYEVSYYPLPEGACDWTSMADAYGNLLLGDRTAEAESRVSLRFEGMIYKDKPFLGIPVSTAIALTPYDSAAEILQVLADVGIPAVAEYQNWNNNTARNRMGGVKASGTLGGSKAFSALLEKAERLDAPVYFTTNALSFSSENALIARFTDAATKLSSFPVELHTFSISTHKEDETIAHDYVIKADKAADKAADLLAAYGKLGAKASLGDAANLLYSDYTSKTGNRSALKAAVTELLDGAGATLMSWPNAYALPYAAYVTDVPMHSSSLSLADEAVPFYARVLQGRVGFSGAAVNLADEPRTAFLYALESGGDLAFTLAAENTDELRFSDDSALYAIRFEDWKDTIIAMQTELNAVRSGLGGLISRESAGKTVTLRHDGGVLVLNYDTAAAQTAFGPVEGLGYLIVPGEEAAQ